MTVLLVDDNVDQLSIRALLLGQHGFETISAINREQALTAAGSTPPHCAIVDLCLPDLETGLATLRDLRARSADTRLIALTGYGTETWQHAAARELADDVVVKGSGVAVLMDSLKKSPGAAIPLL